MRIAVDIEPYFRNKAGVGRYVEGILGGLTRLEEPDDFTLFRSRTYAGAPGLGGLDAARVREVVLPHSHRGLQLRWLLTQRPRVERQSGVLGPRLRPPALEQPTVHQQALAAHLQQVAGTSHLARRAPARPLHGGTVPGAPTRRNA